MSTALRKFEYAHIKSYTVEAASTATVGRLASFGASDTTVADSAAAADDAIGVFLTGGAAGDRVDIALFGPTVAVLVGTGGATRGSKAVNVANGVTDAPAHAAGGATANQIYGIFMQSGLAGDVVGMQILASNRVSA